MAYLFSVDLNISDIIFEHGGHIDLGELVFAEDNEETRFTAGAVADDHQLLADGRHDVVELGADSESDNNIK